MHTHREDFVIDLYEGLNIEAPDQINEENIAQKLDIKLTFWRHPSKHDMLLGSPEIYICTRVPKEYQRLHFFHELGHILRHVDVNRFVDPASMFSNWIESDARLFEYYASLPYHMLKHYNLSDSTVIDTVVEDFVIPRTYVNKRIAHVMQQLKQEELKQAYEGSVPTKSKSYNPDEWSNETQRIMNQLRKQTGQEVVNYVGLF
ncbi:ImmA/IrrE family metallo-endopeptidase [Salibacterium halotolerans]|uniref:IrrE N-terminal-like domain-containing protein n=1 Tax=Salibacterium halotolerans TaxID=1884432 RepID=A0A1I5MK71_9BACI|nr:ImmA/IrrE family metallo-endopeptidase [Salibacterium halotolerans]SFP09316.1 protein of unknown function [Salibacterium halotolerans]